MQPTTTGAVSAGHSWAREGLAVSEVLWAVAAVAVDSGRTMLAPAAADWWEAAAAAWGDWGPGAVAMVVLEETVYQHCCLAEQAAVTEWEEEGPRFSKQAVAAALAAAVVTAGFWARTAA